MSLYVRTDWYCSTPCGVDRRAAAATPCRSWLTSVNRTEPVTISGLWYSSPIFFQNSASEKIGS